MFEIQINNEFPSQKRLSLIAFFQKNALLLGTSDYVLYCYKEVTVLFIQGDEKKRGKITLRAKIWVDISIVLAPNKVMEEKKTNLVIVGVRIAS